MKRFRMSPLDSCFPRFSAKAKTFWTPVEKTPLSSKSELRNQEDEEEVEDEENELFLLPFVVVSFCSFDAFSFSFSFFARRRGKASTVPRSKVKTCIKCFTCENTCVTTPGSCLNVRES